MTAAQMDWIASGRSLTVILSALARRLSQLCVPVLAILVALVVGAFLMFSIGIDPIGAYGQLWAGIASSNYQIGITLVKATPLLLAGLGLGFAFRCGVFNIGGEGQIYMGALLGTVVGLQDWGLPAPLHLALTLLAGFVGGGAWGAVPGFLKARFQVNEVITTILLNYIAIFLVSFFTHGPLKEDPRPAAMPHTAEVLESARLAIVWPGTRLHLGFVFAVAIAVLMWFLTFRTTFGFKARAVGHSLLAACYAGMRVVPIIVLAMVISGGLAGLAGTIEILGVQRRLRDAFSPGTGYTAIAIALLGRNHPVGIVLSAILFGALQAGVSKMEALAGVPSTIVEIIQAVVIFLVALSVVWRSAAPGRWLRRLLRPRRFS